MTVFSDLHSKKVIILDLPRILPPDENAAARARARWNAIAKPVGSLGLFEDAVVKIAALRGSEDVRLVNRLVIVMCADNGVVEEGVTQSPQSVTSLVAGNMAKGDSSVCRMGACFKAKVLPVDIGMAGNAEGVLNKKIARGTKNMVKGPAMTREEAEQAIETGIALVKEQKEKGCDAIVTGEMGIGNTTTSAAIASVLLRRPVEEMTGRGAGLSDAGLIRKIAAIKKAVEVNRPDPDDAFDVLCKLGGFDIAGMCGLFIGGALYGVPVIIDGFISAVAALVAMRLAPGSEKAMLASHESAEPAVSAVIRALNMHAPITARLRLGEGTGGVCLLPLLDAALSVYHGMVAFGDIGMEPYEVYTK